VTGQPAPQPGAAAGPGDELRPTWDLYRRMAGSSDTARREAVLWALGQLEHLMGQDWLERYWEAAGHVPSEVNLGSGHVAATGNLLDVALRYHILASAPGAGKVQREMRSDLRDERRWHSFLQLEVAALAARAGFTVALEERSPPSASPSDVTIRRDGQELRVETFAVLRDKRAQEAAAYWDWLMGQTRQISWKFGVGISGEITARLSPDDGEELLRQIRVAAKTVAATGQAQPVEFGSAQLTVLPPGAGSYQLTGAAEQGQGWPRIESRLIQKARQAARSGSGWLRVDVLDGMWQFTPWARAGLRAKIDEIASLIKQALDQVPGTDGAVLTSGAVFAQGDFYGESARAAQDCYALRRVLPARRVRETMIVPVTARGRSQAEVWRDLYNAEDSWLDWALGRAGLRSCADVFGH
jgi:hypothetical protein